MSEHNWVDDAGRTGRPWWPEHNTPTLAEIARDEHDPEEEVEEE